MEHSLFCFHIYNIICKIAAKSNDSVYVHLQAVDLFKYLHSIRLDYILI